MEETREEKRLKLAYDFGKTFLFVIIGIELGLFLADTEALGIPDDFVKGVSIVVFVLGVIVASMLWRMVSVMFKMYENPPERVK